MYKLFCEVSVIKNFGTAINCIDGRTQLPVIQWMKDKFSIDYLDMITEPGPINKLSLNKLNCSIVASIYQKVVISTQKHFSQVISIVAHEDCLGNPISKEKQIEQLKLAHKVVQKWKVTKVVVALWIDESQKIEQIL